LVCPASVNTPAAVTFRPTNIQAEAFVQPAEEWTAVEILQNACPKQFEAADEVLRSSFTSSNNLDFIPSNNGFVNTILAAYNEHRALVIRPDDVWLAILTQFNFFINANAEILRSQFVSHKGKRQLIVTAAGNRYTVDFGRMANEMTEVIDKNVVDPTLRAWILPDFTTTTNNDIIVSSVVMMATLKQYFSYKFVLMCGIPHVTLEGEKADWEKILKRLEKLKEYGLQTIAWYHLLHPVVSRFVQAFDEPHASENLDFWRRVAHYQFEGSGSRMLSGWITAFCTFDEKGKWMGLPFQEVRFIMPFPPGQTKSAVQNPQASDDPTSLSSSEFFERYLILPPVWAPPPWPGEEVVVSNEEPYLRLDGTYYPRIDSQDVPLGFAEVDVLIDDHGYEFNATMTAGQVGMQVCSSGEKSLSRDGERDTVRPVAGWWIFSKKEKEEAGNKEKEEVGNEKKPWYRFFY
jgi:hypothetical protein